MTTIVATRTGMASDSWMTDSVAATRASVPKFWRIKKWLIGGAGTYTSIIMIVDALKKSKEDPDVTLRDLKLVAKDVDLLLLSPAGKLFMSEDAGCPLPISDGFAAVGSGAQGALVALHLGCSPQEAIAAVRKVDPSTGGRIITRTL